MFTGVRDYIHVMDLADAHVAAVQKSLVGEFKGWSALNVGTGRGYSVLDIVAAFEKASGKKVPYEFAPRREGDIAVSYANCDLSAKELNWRGKRSLDEICKSLSLD